MNLKLLLHSLLLFAPLAVLGDAVLDQREVAAELDGLIHKDGLITVYSLDPQPVDAAGPNEFHGYKILGKKEVHDAGDRKELLAKLADSIRQSDGLSDRCFIPRHGVRLSSNGKTIDWVICFECKSGRRYGATYGIFTLTDTANPIFDVYLDKHWIQRNRRQ